MNSESIKMFFCFFSFVLFWLVSVWWVLLDEAVLITLLWGKYLVLMLKYGNTASFRPLVDIFTLFPYNMGINWIFKLTKTNILLKYFRLLK